MTHYKFEVGAQFKTPKELVLNPMDEKEELTLGKVTIKKGTVVTITSRGQFGIDDNHYYVDFDGKEVKEANILFFEPELATFEELR